MKVLPEDPWRNPRETTTASHKRALPPPPDDVRVTLRAPSGWLVITTVLAGFVIAGLLGERVAVTTQDPVAEVPDEMDNMGMDADDFGVDEIWGEM